MQRGPSAVAGLSPTCLQRVPPCWGKPSPALCPRRLLHVRWAPDLSHPDHFCFCAGIQVGRDPLRLFRQSPLRVRQVGGAVAG